MKVYIYSQHIIAPIISLGQNMGMQNVILPGLINFIYCVVFIIYPWFPTHPRT